MSAVIVYGPAGCGKTRNAEALRKKYGLRRVRDGVEEDELLDARPKSGELILMQAPPRHSHGARVIAFKDTGMVGA